ncbi:MAG TPA: thiamine pyrophosphate-dependent enzyme, partial [Vicinamibacterales bacterium]
SFHDRHSSGTPLSAPDFVKIADAHGLPGVHVSTRDQARAAIRHARASAGPVLIDFHVLQEEAVDPAAAPGAALHEMIHTPQSARPESSVDRP